MLQFDKATCLSLLFNNIWSKRFSNRLWGLDVLLFRKFRNIVFILHYNFIEFIILLYFFLLICFARWKKYCYCYITNIVLYCYIILIASAGDVSSPTRYLSILTDGNASIFVASLLVSYCSFPFLIWSSITMIRFYILSKRFFLNYNELSDAKVV